jgi:hypothetical protein
VAAAIQFRRALTTETRWTWGKRKTVPRLPMAARLRWSGALVSRPPAGCGADVLDAWELFGELWGSSTPRMKGVPDRWEVILR